ncbi:MAG: LysM peptidoglycan-binding domain-containing protein [Lachnospiraceae bacterium]|nr:LysM peptidoglycan-binding domain-containing protein [Lachnospiraceae bacterium]
MIAVEKNDCLWKIAQKVYGDGDLWRVIYDANSAVIKSNYVIYTGQILTIPGVNVNQAETAIPAPETAVPAPETLIPAPETPVPVETPAPAPNFMIDEK